MLRLVKMFVAPLLKSKKWQSICEIGASLGESTSVLACYPNVRVTVIDPCFDCDLAEKFVANSRVTVQKGTSLDVLPKLDTAFDCILIDGDHNWYTVYQELKTISAGGLLRPGGLIFLHDVGWPWGRRDMYYRPDSIPPQFLQKWDLHGIARGKSESSPSIQTLAYLSKATHEGGPANGVLTAVEDFVKEHRGQYRFFVLHAGVGLGIVQYSGSLMDRFTFLLLRAKGLVCSLAIRLLRLTKPLPSNAANESADW